MNSSARCMAMAKFALVAFIVTTVFTTRVQAQQPVATSPSKPIVKTLPTNLADWTGRWVGTADGKIEPNALQPNSNAAPTKPAAAQAPPPFNWNSIPYDLTPEYAAKHEAILKEDKEGKFYGALATCMNPGMPATAISLYLVEFLVKPEKVVILYELMGQFRQIFTDGRKHPPEDELTDTYNGHSIGHWEGNTLVVDTVGIKDATFLDRTTMHSDALHIIERYRLIDSKTMELQMTIIDPKALKKPYTGSYPRVRDEKWDIQEFVCTENNRNKPDDNGVAPSKSAGE